MKVLDLLAYSQSLRHGYLDAFSKLPWEEFVKDRGASFGSMRDIFLHCVNVLDYFVNHIIQGDTERPGMNFDDFDSIEKVKAYVERVESGANRYLEKLTPKDFSRIIEREKDGVTIQVTVEDMLIHFFQEETHHRGEFIAFLWQMNIEPPHFGWDKYLNRELFNISK
jgi:uncharacterized damage-inducible protein DinB